MPEEARSLTTDSAPIISDIDCIWADSQQQEAEKGNTDDEQARGKIGQVMNSHESHTPRTPVPCLAEAMECTRFLVIIYKNLAFSHAMEKICLPRLF